MMTPRQWRDFYACERATLGEHGLEALLESAPAVSLPRGGAIVFPHTKLAVSGRLVAAAARAVIDSGAERVLAIGVLHGGRRLGVARGVHAQAPDEFSLDGFAALLDIAAKSAGRAAPELVRRFPFDVGTATHSLHGLDELLALQKSGCAIVATADPIHYGVGYDQPAATLVRESSEARGFARAAIGEGFALLARGEWSRFLEHAAETRSDFRDAGIALAATLGVPFEVAVHDVELVDYSDVLHSEQPTWVAGALATFIRAE